MGKEDEGIPTEASLECKKCKLYIFNGVIKDGDMYCDNCWGKR